MLCGDRVVGDELGEPPLDACAAADDGPGTAEAGLDNEGDEDDEAEEAGAKIG